MGYRDNTVVILCLPDTRACTKADIRVGVSLDFTMVIAINLQKEKEKSFKNIV